MPIFIGFMLKRALFKAAMHQRVLTPRNRADGVMVGLLLFLLYFGNLLHQCGDIELNPGPPKQDSLRQTRLTSGSRTRSVERNITPENTTAANVNQAGESLATDPTLKDVMYVLTSMNSKFDDLKCDMSDIKEAYSSLKEEVREMKETISDLKEENRVLKEEKDEMHARLESVEKKTDDLEGRSKRNNIIIHGIPRHEKETGQDCEELVCEMLTDKLELGENVQFDRVHRLNAKPNSPIVARCTFYKDKERVMKEKRKLKGSDVFIGDDFSLKVREVRRKLIPHLKAAKNEKKRATMIFDHLLIEGRKFVLDKHDKLQETA